MGGPALKLIWKNFGIAAAPQMRVEATVRLERSRPMSQWQIAISDLGSLRIEKVRFPRVTCIRQQPDERLAVPQWMGEIAKEPRRVICDQQGQPRRVEWPYPGALSLQCLALYRDNGPGLYSPATTTPPSERHLHSGVKPTEKSHPN